MTTTAQDHATLSFIKAAFRSAYHQVRKADGDGGDIVKQGVAFGDADNDTEIAMDKTLAMAISRELGNDPEWKRISCEGSPDVHADHAPAGQTWYCVDPLDGSLNYRLSARAPHAIGLPYTTCITAVKMAERPTFGDIFAAGIADLRLGGALLLGDSRLSDEQVRSVLETDATLSDIKQSGLTGPDKLDLGSQLVIGEMYYPENRDRLCRAFAGKKGYLRSIGSAAYEMLLVVDGTATAFICDRQKQHELGAGYLLVKSAGGVAVDFDGHDLGPREFDFKTQTPVVLACNQAIADQILELLHR